MSFWASVLVIFRKDLAMEARGKELMTTIFMFALLTVIIFNFAFEMNPGDAKEVAAGILWVSFLFAGALTMNRSFLYEKEEDCLAALMLAPIDRSAIYFGKVLSNLLITWGTVVVIVPIFTVLYNVNVMERFGWQTLSFALGTSGFVVVGSLIAAISVNLRAREMMGPLLLLPVVTPVIIAAVKLTGGLIMGYPIDSLMIWVKILVAFNVVYLVVGWLLFEYIVEEG